MDEKWIFLLIINRDRTVTDSVDTSSKWRKQALHLGLHHFNPPSQWQAHNAKARLGRATMDAHKDRGDANSSM